jgi:hypothetical protein
MKKFSALNVAASNSFIQMSACSAASAKKRQERKITTF